MTDNQINVAIAEACGWTDIHDDPMWGWLGRPPNSAGKGWPILPYCECLNAMHEAEKTLSETNMFVMAHHIERLVSSHGQHYFHATARQRAEAFLRAIGRWEE